MQIQVIRRIFNEDCTLGEMLIDGEFFAHTLEPTFRNLNGDCSKKVQNKTCIDNGEYLCQVTFSNHFKKYLPEILNTTCFQGVRIHGGNKPADTEACILIGSETNNKDWVGNCSLLVEEITEKIKDIVSCKIVISSNSNSKNSDV